MCLVRVTGLEPAHRSALEPKSNVSANFTTPAYKNPNAEKHSDFGGKRGINFYRFFVFFRTLSIPQKSLFHATLQLFYIYTHYVVFFENFRNSCTVRVRCTAVFAFYNFDPHAPRGARLHTARALIKPCRYFNSHAPRGARPESPAYSIDTPEYFNSHAPRGARPLLWLLRFHDIHISTHTPREGSD